MMAALLAISAFLLFMVLVFKWTIERCLASDPEADRMEVTGTSALPQAAVEEMDATSAYAEACNPGPMLALRTHRVLMPHQQMSDADIKRRVVIGVGFVLAMTCLSAWVGAR